MILFLDSSALVKRYLDEPGSPTVIKLMAVAERCLASRMTWLEATSAVARVEREGNISDAPEVLRALDEDFTSLIGILEITDDVISAARELCLRHALRAADALQLATARVAVGRHGSGTRFVCADKRLLLTARAEGLETMDPNTC